MQKNRAATYLGFCQRAGKLTLGVNAAATLKKGVFLLVMDESTASNSRKEIEKLQRKFACPLAICTGLEEIVHKAWCKLAAVRDKDLAEAIMREAGNGFITEIIGGME